MHCDCASGNVDHEWEVEKPLTCPQFCQRMGEQMTEYQTVDENYPGDEFLRGTTKFSKKQRARKQKRKALEMAVDGDFRISYSQYLDAKYPRGQDKVAQL